MLAGVINGTAKFRCFPRTDPDPSAHARTLTLTVRCAKETTICGNYRDRLSPISTRRETRPARTGLINPREQARDPFTTCLDVCIARSVGKIQNFVVTFYNLLLVVVGIGHARILA